MTRATLFHRLCGLGQSRGPTRIPTSRDLSLGTVGFDSVVAGDIAESASGCRRSHKIHGISAFEGPYAWAAKWVAFYPMICFLGSPISSSRSQSMASSGCKAYCQPNSARAGCGSP